jgi:hypothetical protein
MVIEQPNDSRPLMQCSYGHPDGGGCQFEIFSTEDKFLDTRSPGAVHAYRTLKLGMAAIKSRAKEGMFFTLEQRSPRNDAIAAHRRRLWRLGQQLRAWISRITVQQRVGEIDGTATTPQHWSAPMPLHEIVLS